MRQQVTHNVLRQVHVERESLLRDNGVDHVFIDDGEIAGDVRDVIPIGVDRVLESGRRPCSIRCGVPLREASSA